MCGEYMTLLKLTEAEKKIMIKAVPVVLGIPYRFGQEVRDKEIPYTIDCSELMEWFYRIAGWIVPDGACNQFAASLPIKDYGNVLETGDMIFTWKNKVINHVAMVIDKFKLIEASGWKKKVVITPISEFIHTYKIPEPGQTVNHSTVHPDGFRRFIMEQVKARP
jgi:cell wall-associated NlpC family hydrolase